MRGRLDARRLPPLQHAAQAVAVARLRRDLMMARVLRSHELVSAKAAALPEREKLLRDAEKAFSEAEGKARKRYAAANEAAGKRDALLHKHLAETVGKTAWPWVP